MSTAQVAKPLGVPSWTPPPRPWLQLYNVHVKPPPAYVLEDDAELALIQRVFTDEMMGTIFSKLGPYALGHAACVCRQWRYLARNPSLWETACREALSPPAHRDIPPERMGRVLASDHGCSWRRMFLEVPHVRFDGVYVARNTYIRVGAVELHRSSSTVFLACYYRYYRFFPNGQLLYRTSPHVLKLVARSLARTPAVLQAARVGPKGPAHDDAQHVYIGRYCVTAGSLRTVIRYPNARGTEVRAKLGLRSTSPGAWNRLDVESLCTYDWESGVTSPFPTDPRADEDGYGEGADRQEHRRGLAPFVFVPWEQALTTPLNLPPSKMDVFLPG